MFYYIYKTALLYKRISTIFILLYKKHVYFYITNKDWWKIFS